MRYRCAGGVVCGVLVAGMAASSLRAGDLNPPAGPVAPTMKALDVVEPRTPVSTAPFVITEPGSYYLTGNLAPAAGPAIEINAPGVTLDLAGFTIEGAPTQDHAVVVNAARVRVHNGVIRHAQRGAVYVDPGANAAVLEDLRIESVAVEAIPPAPAVLLGPDARVERVHIEFARQGIIIGGDNVVIIDCTLADIIEQAIAPDAALAANLRAARVEGCSVRDAGTGISVPDASVVSDCTVLRTATGIKAPGSVVERCTVEVASSFGVDLGPRGILRHSIVRDAAIIGVIGRPYSLIEGCQIRGNSTIGISGGVLTLRHNRLWAVSLQSSGDSTIEGNEIVYNVVGTEGFRAGLGDTIRGNGFKNCTVTLDSARIRFTDNTAGNCVVTVGGFAMESLIARNSLYLSTLNTGAAPGSVIIGPTNDLTSPFSNIVQ